MQNVTNDATLGENRENLVNIPIDPVLDQTRKIGKYIVGPTLGKGGFSKVRLGVHCETGHRVALKILKKNELKNESANVKIQVKREIESLARIQSENVIRLYEVVWNAKYPKKNGKVIDVILVVLELATGGEFFEFLQVTGAFEETIARTYFRQLMSAIHLCHSLNIAHRDIKPENLLLDDTFVLKVADFGFANAFNPAMPVLMTICGTEAYMAPEMFERGGYDPRKCDIWACGVVLFTTLAGFPPFGMPNMSDWWFNKLKRNKHALFWQAHCRSAYFTKEAKDLINKLLCPDPRKRIRIAEIMSHPWFNGPILVPAALQRELEKRKKEVSCKRALKRKEEKRIQHATGNNRQVFGGPVYRSIARTIDADSEDLPPTYPQQLMTRKKAYKGTVDLSANGRFLEEKELVLVKHDFAKENVPCYTRFASKAKGPLLFQRLHAVLSRFEAKIAVKGGCKFKANLSTGGMPVSLTAQIFQDSTTKNLRHIVFKRKKGQASQFRALYMAFLDDMSDLADEN